MGLVRRPLHDELQEGLSDDDLVPIVERVPVPGQEPPAPIDERAVCRPQVFDEVLGVLSDDPRVAARIALGEPVGAADYLRMLDRRQDWIGRMQLALQDIALTIIEPYFMYWTAEQFGSSGVLAVVSGGLFMANRRLLFLNSTSRVRGYSVWESFVFILNGIVFLLIGLQLPEIADGLRADGVPLGTAIGYGVLVTGVLIAARIISSYAALVTTYIFRPHVAPRGQSRKQTWLLVFFFSGSRFSSNSARQRPRARAITQHARHPEKPNPVHRAAVSRPA